MESLIEGMFLGDLDEYNVPLYKEQVRRFWHETKIEFLTLVDWRRTQSPDSEEFYRRTLEWTDLFKAIQEGYCFDDSCYVVRVGHDPVGTIAAAIIGLRNAYSYYFDMMHIEGEEWLDREFGDLAKKVEQYDYWLESILPGVTRIEGPPSEMVKSTTYTELIHELKVSYLDPTTIGYPIAVAYSGGKDSTLVVKAYIEMLEALPAYQRVRPVHILSCDTGLEFPNIIENLVSNCQEIQEYALVKNLPVTVHLLQPEVSQKYFPLLVGLGYLPPRRMTKWCVQRLKINVTQAIIRKLALEFECCIVVLGTRESESVSRSNSIRKHSNGNERYNSRANMVKSDNQLQVIRQLVYQTIRYFSTNAVWNAFEKDGFPWGLGYSRMKKLYKDASGECPLVADTSKQGTCGGRYGCYLCTLISEDKAMLSLLQNGYGWMKPIHDYRKFMISLAENPNMREQFMYDRKSGKILKEKSQGGFNKKGRRLLFSKLMKLRELIARTKPADLQFEVISDEEIEQIQKYWLELDQVNLWKNEDPQLQLNFS